MIKQIGAFTHQTFIAFDDRGDTCLDRFFTELLRDLVDALGIQARGLGRFRIGVLAALNDLKELKQDFFIDAHGISLVAFRWQLEA